MTDPTRKVQPIPADYGSITPYFVVRGVPKFIEFLVAAFGAVERGRTPNPDGTIGHAEVWIGNSVIQMFDAKENWREYPNFTTLYVDDCDATFKNAVAAGATAITELSTNAWGDRAGRIRDPLGNIWWIQTHIEEVAPEEMQRRMGEQTYLDQMSNFQETLIQEMDSRQ